MVGRRLISGRQALGVEMDMRNALYARLVRKSFRFYDTHQTGQLMSRATVDLQGVRFFLGYGLIFFFQNILVVLSVTVVLFFVQWELALIALAIVPFLIVLAYRYSHLSHPTLRDVQQKLADVATVAQESIVGVHVVKAFAQEPAEQAKFRDRSEAVFGQTVQCEPPAGLLRTADLVRADAGPGGSAPVRRDHGSRRQPLDRQLRLLQPLPRHARAAAALARNVDRTGPASDRLRRADLPGHGRAGRSRRPLGRRRPPGGTGRGSLRGRLVPLPRRATGAQRRRPGRAGRPDDRPDRAHRLGQDDADLARPPLLRRHRRPGHGGRPGRPRPDACLAAAGSRRHLAGPVPLLCDSAREHRVRRRRPAAGSSRGGRARRRRRTSSSSGCRKATTP